MTLHNCSTNEAPGLTRGEVSRFPPLSGEAVEEALRVLGFASLSDFLATLPAIPYNEVARRLGDGVAPIVVILFQYKEAKRRNRVREAAIDGLIRNVVERLPNGWTDTPESARRLTFALASWETELVGTAAAGLVEYEHLARAITLDPPHGWKPTRNDDPVVNKAFNKCWPTDFTVT